MRNFALSIAILALCSVRAEAQSDSLLTRVLTDTSSLLGRLTLSQKRSVSPTVEIRATRLASASGGFMFGMVLGGFAGHELGGEDCSGNCHTLRGESLLTGAAIGGALGAAIGSAFLDLRSVCEFDRRLLRTLAGAAAGASAFFAAGGGFEKRRGRSAFFVPIGAVGGSLGTLGRCWKARF